MFIRHGLPMHMNDCRFVFVYFPNVSLWNYRRNISMHIHVNDALYSLRCRMDLD